MSIFDKVKKLSDVATDNTYLIYGPPGTGKTTLASTFPKSKEKPMLILDILEGGTGAIPERYVKEESIQVLPITSFTELDEVMTDLLNGYYLDAKGSQVKLDYSSIVIDSATQLEYLLKEYLKESSGKDQMNIKLWSLTLDNQDFIYNVCKAIHTLHGVPVIVIAHEVDDYKNEIFQKTIPQLMKKAAYRLAAKVSYVWHTDIVGKFEMQADGTEIEVNRFVTTIEADSKLVTKCRKPLGKVIPKEVTNFSYPKFQKLLFPEKVEAKTDGKAKPKSKAGNAKSAKDKKTV